MHIYAKEKIQVKCQKWNFFSSLLPPMTPLGSTALPHCPWAPLCHGWGPQHDTLAAHGGAISIPAPSSLPRRLFTPALLYRFQWFQCRARFVINYTHCLSLSLYPLSSANHKNWIWMMAALDTCYVGHAKGCFIASNYTYRVFHTPCSILSF